MAHAVRLPALIHAGVGAEKRRTSEILAEIAERCDHRWTFGEIGATLGKRGFGLSLLVFALPNTIPLPIPGISTITSVPLIFLSAQLCLGREALWLPQWLARRSIAGDKLKLLLKCSLPWIIRLEKSIKCRAEIMAGQKAQRFAGAAIFVLAGLIALPIPLGNLPLGIAIAAFALAITEQDGWVMITGWLLTVLALVYFVGLIAGYAWLLWQALGFIT